LRKSLVRIFNYMVAHKGKEVKPPEVDRASGKPGYSSKHMSMLRRWGCKVDTIRGVTNDGGNGREALAYVLLDHPDELPIHPTNLKHPKGKKRPRRDAQAVQTGRKRTPVQEEQPKRPKVSVAKHARRSTKHHEERPTLNGQSPPALAAGGENLPAPDQQEQVDFVRDLGMKDRNLCDVDPDFTNLASDELSDVDHLLDDTN
jgi:hypothetical protein